MAERLNIQVELQPQQRNISAGIQQVSNGDVQLKPNTYNIDTEVAKDVSVELGVSSKTQQLQMGVESKLQDIEVEISSSLIYAFSPSARVDQLPNGNYLVTIIDKDGTTTAEIPRKSSRNRSIDNEHFFDYYFQTHAVLIQRIIREANTYEERYNQLKELIQGAIDVYIPENTNGIININNTNYQVYTLPDTTLDSEDILILDCGNSLTQY